MVKELRLHLPVVPGISLNVKALRTYKSGQLKQSFDPVKNLFMASWGGFYLKNGYFLSISDEGDMVSIFPPFSGGNGFGEIDHIKMVLEFQRLGIANLIPCGGTVQSK